MNITEHCPCQSGHAYAACCARYHQGIAAPTAEALMRSRYSAYLSENERYLLDSWHPTTRPASVSFEAGTKWLGLTLKSAQETHNKAEVEFVACYKVGGASAVRLHERSRFVREAGRWFYVDGDLIER